MATHVRITSFYRVGASVMRTIISQRGWLLPNWKSALTHFTHHHLEDILSRGAYSGVARTTGEAL